jgi:TolB protein
MTASMNEAGDTSAARARGQWLAALLALTLLILAAHSALAQGQPQPRPQGPLRVEIDEGNLNPIRIAIPDFVGDDLKLAADIAGVVAADLDRSGLFKSIDPAAFIERMASPDGAPRFGDWKAIGAQALVVGRVGRTGDGRILAQVRLWDVGSGRQLFGQEFRTGAQNWRRIGHIIADAIYEKMLGEKGYFDTRVVFVDESGPKERRIKRLAIMDQDGHNLRLLSQGRELVLTPRFSPTSQEITFMAYEGENPRVFLMNLETGQRELVGNFPGMTFAPRFSPDGQRIVMSLQADGGAHLYEMDLRTRRTRQLTSGRHIDTGPSFAPDGRAIVFESDREGTQQLYVMGADGAGARRISNGGGRYSTPVWSPRGDFIAFTKQEGGEFKIGVMKPNGEGERILSSGYHNEGPSWAPNGRVLMFFRERQGKQGGPKLFTVDVSGYNERALPTPAFASDPAWSPRVN